MCANHDVTQGRSKTSKLLCMPLLCYKAVYSPYFQSVSSLSSVMPRRYSATIVLRSSELHVNCHGHFLHEPKSPETFRRCSYYSLSTKQGQHLTVQIWYLPLPPSHTFNRSERALPHTHQLTLTQIQACIQFPAGSLREIVSAKIILVHTHNKLYLLYVLTSHECRGDGTQMMSLSLYEINFEYVNVYS